MVFIMKARFAHFLYSFSILKVLSFLKVTFIVGSHAIFFSYASCCYPVIGAFNGVGSLVVIFGSTLVAKILLGGMVPLYHLAYHIPGFCAALVWAKPQWRLTIVLPLFAFAAFLLHPVGWQAGLYTLYWLVPLCISFFSLKHPFFKALASTFVAHAVGSVIWLYTVPMAAEQWLSLIPAVACERLLFATGATLLFYFAKIMYFYMENYCQRALALLTRNSA